MLCTYVNTVTVRYKFAGVNILVAAVHLFISRIVKTVHFQTNIKTLTSQ